MWDMFAWGYKYGHDLDPRAAIKVEGMAYQPPLIGHKKLLNFDAWSLPDTGGWILFAAISIAALIWFIEWKWPRKPKLAAAPVLPAQTVGGMVTALAVLTLGLSAACTAPGPPVIDFGKAECASCRMNVVDRQFASAIVTKKGRTYTFDSPECMVQHVADGSVVEDEVASWWVCDHAHPGTLIDATKAYYLASPELRSPMNGNTAAFASGTDRTNTEATFHGEPLDWSAARARLATH
jgi:copper chaperone NosL